MITPKQIEQLEVCTPNKSALFLKLSQLLCIRGFGTCINELDTEDENRIYISISVLTPDRRGVITCYVFLSQAFVKMSIENQLLECLEMIQNYQREGTPTAQKGITYLKPNNELSSDEWIEMERFYKGRY